VASDHSARDGDFSTTFPERDDVLRLNRRELVVVNPPARERPSSRLADATFLAHMFATKIWAPQTREKRRADPSDANRSYRKATQPSVPTGRLVSRSI